MPFESEKQRRYMWAKHPKIARRWANEEKKKGSEYSNKHAGAHARTSCEGVIVAGKHKACS